MRTAISLARDEDLGVGEVVQAAGVVGVQMGHHEQRTSPGAIPSRLELGADLLLRLDRIRGTAQGTTDASAGSSRAARRGGLAGVDDDHALGMLDRERVDRQRLGPLAIEQRVAASRPAVPDALALVRRNRRRYRSGLRGCSSVVLLSFGDLVGGCEPTENQLDDALGELLVDRAAGDQQPVEERAAEHVERELEVEVRAQVAALDPALEHSPQCRAPSCEEPVTDQRELARRLRSSRPPGSASRRP